MIRSVIRFGPVPVHFQNESSVYQQSIRNGKCKITNSESVWPNHHFTNANNSQNFVLKVYIVITSKVFADFCFESPISIDFQSEILALLRPKSAKTLEVITIHNLRSLWLVVDENLNDSFPQNFNNQLTCSDSNLP